MAAEGLRPATLAAQALGWVDEATRAIIPPLHPATTFLRDPDNQFRSGRIYGRDDSPAYDQAEALLAALEGGEGALVFASGNAAAAALFQALAPGDHVIAPAVMYWGLRAWLRDHAVRWGLEVSFLPEMTAAALSAVLRVGRTKLIWVETPANPTWAITDIAAVAALARAHGARVCVDNTAATPVLTRPLALGADYVMHSATKYLNGHSDVVAGALVTALRDAAWDKVRAVRRAGGAVLGPFEAWLLVRGMRTLYLRVSQACRSAERIAGHLAAHPRVAAVLYPGLPGHPGHAIAKAQMTGGFGGTLSIRVAGGEMAAVAVAARTTVFKRATSLGGVESLIEHRASIEGAGSSAPPDLLRLSVGIEDTEDLIADLDQALSDATGR
ncbi:MAG: aminotransferase class V-fold PLP-dependent enzyme [Alphaproteobacteria bacterium]|nr:aminotransferase class V-fold PLP-dependent enzyme [Alphaproteobacteria bacterium]